MRIRNEATVGQSHQFSAISLQSSEAGSLKLDARHFESLDGCPVPRAKKGVMHSQNEGTTHDVDENKGHKIGMLVQPTMLMIINDLFSLSHDVYEK